MAEKRVEEGSQRHGKKAPIEEYKERYGEFGYQRKGSDLSEVDKARGRLNYIRNLEAELLSNGERLGRDHREEKEMLEKILGG